MKRRRPSSAPKSETLEFLIDHMDPLGQGVHKQAKEIAFVPGTLPGETGSAEVYKRAKGVRFAKLKQLDTRSAKRVEPACPHFDQCPGCQYLHTDYDQELDFKQDALLRHLSGLKLPDNMLEIIPAPHRLSYRNRVQLHYRHKYIGMLDATTNQVVEIPQCKIFRSEMQPAFDALYEEKDWQESQTGHGHCELSLNAGEVKLRWNQSYASGGFSQVYEEMNQVLQVHVQQLLSEQAPKHLLDLFSGDGNLSNAYAAAGGNRVLVDSTLDSSAEAGYIDKTQFFKLDLYGDDALSRFAKKYAKSSFDTLLIDPPRRGFVNLDNWIKKLKPRNLIYVSCNPASLARDLKSISKAFKVESISLLDLFPGTAHFETLVSLKFKQADKSHVRN